MHVSLLRCTQQCLIRIFKHGLLLSKSKSDVCQVIRIVCLFANVIVDTSTHFRLQGTVLSAFFWGYCMTQIIGGYFSDRIGGDIVIVVAAVGWTLVTFWTPQLLYLSTDKTTVLSVLTLSRVLMACLQGNLNL